MMENEDSINVVATKEQHRKFEAEKLESVSREQLVKGVMALRVRDLFTVVNVLISEVGKEKAKKLLEEAQYSIYHKRGENAAKALEKKGKVNNIAGYIEANTVNLLALIPSAPVPEIIESTDKKYVFRCKKCFQADSLLQLVSGEAGKSVESSGFSGNQDTLEVTRLMCPHDTAWANGFNPDMKFERSKYLLAGGEYCEFKAELK